MKSLTWKWYLIDKLFQLLVKLGLSTSNLATSIAMDEGSTVLHFACQTGNLRQVRWLLNNGARGSLELKNAAGYTPLATAKYYGPHPEVEAAIRAAMMGPTEPRVIEVQACG